VCLACIGAIVKSPRPCRVVPSLILGWTIGSTQECDGKMARQLHVACLRDIVCANRGRTDETANLIDGDDGAILPRAHLGQHHWNHAVIGQHVVLDDLVEGFVNYLCKWSIIEIASPGADQNVDSAENLVRMIDQGLKRLLIRDAYRKGTCHVLSNIQSGKFGRM